MKWSDYNYIYESSRHGTLLFNKLTGAFFDISDPETKAEMLKLKEDPDGYDFTDDPEACQKLLSAGVICNDDDETARNMLTYSLLAARFSPSVKYLTLLPTLDCNLACTYCFEEAHRCSGMMSQEVVDKLKEIIETEYGDGKEPLMLSWFGGEPLLGYGIMKEITGHALSLGISLEAGIITNGVLLNESRINELDELKINNIQITLDGKRETHDKKRKFRNGRGTYDIILANMSALHAYMECTGAKIHVDIRINVDRENKDQYHGLLVELKERFPLFTVYPGIITQYRSCGTSLPCFADQREEALFYIEQYEKYGIIHPEFDISGKGMRSCMAEMVNTQIVGPKGEIYLCLQDVGNPHAVAGTLFDGKNNMPLVSAYCSGNLTFNSRKCRDCEVLTFCGGGCVNKRYRTKKYNEPHDVCAAYKDKDIFEKYLDLHYEIKKRNEQNVQRK